MEDKEIRCAELPEDCWEWVFKRLDYECDFEALSLVCWRFFIITNRLRSHMLLTDRTVLVHGDAGIRRLFCRFPNLKRIDLHDYQGDLDRIVCVLSRSGLRLEFLGLANDKQWFPRSGMQELGEEMSGSLKVLDLSGFVFLNDEDLVAVAESFPNLEEIDVSHCYIADCGPYGVVEPELSGTVTDVGITSISLKLQKLQTINISGNHFVSDQSLIALSSNCPMLSKIVACECSFMRGDGIAFMLRHSPNLKELLAEGIRMASYSSIEKKLFSPARALHCISFSDMSISHDLLVSLAEAGLPLKELALCHCWDLSFGGIDLVLQGYRQSLRRLHLVGICFLTDGGMSSLIRHLGALTFINLSSCMQLSNLTLFGLMKRCLHLEEIVMNGTYIGKGGLLTDSWRNSRIRSLFLANNVCLDDQTLEQIGWVCPKLSSLCITNCWGVSEDGIRVIGERCPEIRELQAMGIQGVTRLGIGLGYSKLEVLKLSGSGIGDKGLSMIAQGCKGLINLELEGCARVTEEGVKEIVSKCKRLRELNLRNCYSVNIELAWMVFSRPSLRKLVSNLFTEKQRDLFVRHGCKVSR